MTDEQIRLSSEHHRILMVAKAAHKTLTRLQNEVSELDQDIQQLKIVRRFLKGKAELDKIYQKILDWKEAFNKKEFSKIQDPAPSLDKLGEAFGKARTKMQEDKIRKIISGQTKPQTIKSKIQYQRSWTKITAWLITVPIAAFATFTIYIFIEKICAGTPPITELATIPGAIGIIALIWWRYHDTKPRPLFFNGIMVDGKKVRDLSTYAFGPRINTALENHQTREGQQKIQREENWQSLKDFFNIKKALHIAKRDRIASQVLTSLLKEIHHTTPTQKDLENLSGKLIAKHSEEDQETRELIDKILKDLKLPEHQMVFRDRKQVTRLAARAQMIAESLILEGETLTACVHMESIDDGYMQKYASPEEQNKEHRARAELEEEALENALKGNKTP